MQSTFINILAFSIIIIFKTLHITRYTHFMHALYRLYEHVNPAEELIRECTQALMHVVDKSLNKRSNSKLMHVVFPMLLPIVWHSFNAHWTEINPHGLFLVQMYSFTSRYC